MRVDLPKKSNVLVQKQKCGISNDVFSCGSGTAEIQVTVYCVKSQYIVRSHSHRLFCMRKQNCWTSRHSIFFVRKRNCGTILCAEAELRDLKSKLLYGSGTAKLQVILNLLYGSGTA